jgi:hypothetical protein
MKQILSHFLAKTWRLRNTGQAIALLVLSATSFWVQAQTREPTPEQVQLEYCATYLPCAIAVGLMDTASQGLSLVERAKRLAASFGAKKVRNGREWREYLDGLTPSERQAYVRRCTAHKGQNMLDECEKEYLTGFEYQAAANARAPKSLPMFKEKAVAAYRLLEEQDEAVYRQIKECIDNQNPVRTCRNLTSSLTGDLERSINRFNRDKELMQFVPPFESRAFAYAANYFDKEQNYDGTIMWSAKASQPAQPSGGSASLRALQGSPSNLPTATADTFASNVSDRLKDDERLRAAQADGQRIAQNFESTQQRIFQNEVIRIEQEAAQERQLRIAQEEARLRSIQEQERRRNDARAVENSQPSNTSQDAAANLDCFNITNIRVENQSKNFCVVKADYTNNCKGYIHVDYDIDGQSENWHQYRHGSSGYTVIRTGGKWCGRSLNVQWSARALF